MGSANTMGILGQVAQQFAQGYLMGRQMKLQNQAREMEHVGRRIEILHQNMASRANDPTFYAKPESGGPSQYEATLGLLNEQYGQLDQVGQGKKQGQGKPSGGIGGFFSRIFGGGGKGDSGGGETDFGTQLNKIYGSDTSKAAPASVGEGVGDATAHYGATGEVVPQAPKGSAPTTGDASKAPGVGQSVAQMYRPGGSGIATSGGAKDDDTYASPGVPRAQYLNGPEDVRSRFMAQYRGAPMQIVDAQMKRAAPTVVNGLQTALDSHIRSKGYQRWYPNPANPQEPVASQDADVQGYLSHIRQWSNITGDKEAVKNFLDQKFHDWRTPPPMLGEQTPADQAKNLFAQITLQGGPQTPQQTAAWNRRIEEITAEKKAGQVWTPEQQMENNAILAMNVPEKSRTPEQNTAIKTFQDYWASRRPQSNTTVNVTNPQAGINPATNRPGFFMVNKANGKTEWVDAVPIAASNQTDRSMQSTVWVERETGKLNEYGLPERNKVPMTFWNPSRVIDQFKSGRIDEKKLQEIAASASFYNSEDRQQLLDFVNNRGKTPEQIAAEKWNEIKNKGNAGTPQRPAPYSPPDAPKR